MTCTHPNLIELAGDVAVCTGCEAVLETVDPAAITLLPAPPLLSTRTRLTDIITAGTVAEKA